MEPRLVLADEPTGNLDTATSEAIHRLFFQLNDRRGTTFLIVTHNPDLAGRMPRVVRMRDGRVEEDERRGAAPAPPRSEDDATATETDPATPETEASAANEAPATGVEAAG